MPGMIAEFLAWPTLGIALLVFGFAPGVVLRLILLLYHRDNPRRRELLSELYRVPRIERPFWVAEQLELAIFEGVRERVKARRDRLLESAVDRLVGEVRDRLETAMEEPTNRADVVIETRLVGHGIEVVREGSPPPGPPESDGRAEA